MVNIQTNPEVGPEMNPEASGMGRLSAVAEMLKPSPRTAVSEFRRRFRFRVTAWTRRAARVKGGPELTITSFSHQIQPPITTTPHADIVHLVL
jgi:hypothetical protein